MPIPKTPADAAVDLDTVCDDLVTTAEELQDAIAQEDWQTARDLISDMRQGLDTLDTAAQKHDNDD